MDIAGACYIPQINALDKGRRIPRASPWLGLGIWPRRATGQQPRTTYEL
jgi:hypothetical protein